MIFKTGVRKFSQRCFSCCCFFVNNNNNNNNNNNVNNSLKYKRFRNWERYALMPQRVLEDCKNNYFSFAFCNKQQKIM